MVGVQAASSKEASPCWPYSAQLQLARDHCPPVVPRLLPRRRRGRIHFQRPPRQPVHVLVRFYFLCIPCLSALHALVGFTMPAAGSEACASMCQLTRQAMLLLRAGARCKRSSTHAAAPTRLQVSFGLQGLVCKPCGHGSISGSGGWPAGQVLPQTACCLLVRISNQRGLLHSALKPAGVGSWQ